MVPTKLAEVIEARYTGIRPAGAGSQGDVFCANDSEANDAPVALKWVSRPEARATAIQEFAHLASVSHPGLTRVLRMHEGATGICLVSAFVTGRPAAAHYQDVPADARPRFLLAIADAMASALGHLHSQGLVHGDVKPDHIVCPAVGSQPAILLDLGLARSAGLGDVRGTPLYMAPEALSGHIDSQADLYSLGVSLIEIAIGEAVFQDCGDGVYSAILEGVLPGVSEQLSRALPKALVTLLCSMIEVDRGRRPSGMSALRAHIRRVAESLGIRVDPLQGEVPTLLSSEFFGRDAEVARLVEMVRSIATPEAKGILCEVSGAAGSGRSRCITEALLRAQVLGAQEGLPCPRIRTVAMPSVWPAATPSAAAFLASHASGDTPIVLVCSFIAATTLFELREARLPNALLLIAEVEEQLANGPNCIAMPPLSLADCELLCRSLSASPPPSDWIRRAATLAQHLPGPLGELLRAASSLDPLHEKSPDALLHDDGLTNALLRRVKNLGRDAAALLEVLAVAARPLAWDTATQLLGASDEAMASASQELAQAGLVQFANGTMRCASANYAKSIDAHLPTSRRKSLHRQVLSICTNLSRTERAGHLLVVGPTAEAASVSLEAIELENRDGNAGAALSLCLASGSVMRGKNISVHAALTAEIALATGDYDLAEEFAKKAQRSRSHEIRLRATAALARCAQHRGDVRESVALLRELASEAPNDGDAGSALAKALLALGDLPEAMTEARRSLALSTTSAARFAATEIIGLAQLYAGNLQASDSAFAELQSFAEESDSERLLGRALGLQGMAAQKHSKLESAAQLYAKAAKHSDRSGAIHAGAVFRLNGATALQRLARYSEALAVHESAYLALARSGTPFELAAAHCNRGNLLLTLGEFASARRQAEEAERLAARAKEPRISFFVHLLHGEICEREHHEETALGHYETAEALGAQHGLSDTIYASMRLAEWHARAKNGKAASLIEALTSDSEEHQGEILSCKARVALATATVSRSLVSALEAQLAETQANGDLDLRWRSAVLLARTFAALGDAVQSSDAATRAQAILAEVTALCPEAYRNGLARHPEALALASLRDAARPREAMTQSAEALPLRRLLALSRKLNSEQRIEPLLDEIIDTAVELSRAERAFLLLRNSEGVLQFRVARNMGGEELGSQEQLSTSIAERVAATGQVVMTVDAEADQRFGGSQSVAALQLRSILAVPFRVKDRIVGTLYLDHRFRRSAFDEAAVDVVRELADIAAVAIENARLTRENRNRQEEIRDLNAKLEDKLQSTEVQLARTRAQVPGARASGAFDAIIGRSKPMRELLAIAERAAACALPVVIHGESGTGKELLARAIHTESARSANAFVPINCGAVPDSLLEAELFGFTRGAFTGAERGKRGLFEVADGGTLFLDEIADTSLAMQSKLLRALQEGEIRPLGAEEVRHVDIRVLCASNKDLWQEVLAGRFREDLYYRLKVLELRIPSLRERREDIPGLATHLVSAKHQLSESALRLLQAYDWPGNVRELENELARASAMADTECISAEHLSVQVMPKAKTADAPADTDLRLKPQVETLERRLVEAAMAQTENNQSKAATLLGLSRYGLQKKLQRYGILGSRI